MNRLKAPFPWFGSKARVARMVWDRFGHVPTYIENGKNPLFRIALCGYDGEHQMPDDWECIEWRATGGYGIVSNGRGRQNAARERIWFSPHCLRSSLFRDL